QILVHLPVVRRQARRALERGDGLVEAALAARDPAREQGRVLLATPEGTRAAEGGRGACVIPDLEPRAGEPIPVGLDAGGVLTPGLLLLHHPLERIEAR